MRCSLTDKDKVNTILRHPEVYIPMTGKDEIAPEGLCDELLANPNAFVLSPAEGCVFIFIPYSEILFYGHYAVLPESRGRVSLRAAQATIDWLFANTLCQSILGLTPISNIPAMYFSQMLGFTIQGLLPASHMEQGKLVDMIIFHKGKV